jgi:hypothetical protein
VQALERPEKLYELTNSFRTNAEGAGEIFRLSGKMYLKNLKTHNGIRKVCALVAATLILPALTYAGTDNGKGNNGENNGKQNGHDKIHSVPEGGPGIVLLITTVGAILLFSARLSSRAKAGSQP